MDQDSNPNKCLCLRPQDCMSLIVLTWISVVCSIFKSTSKGAPCYILKSNTHFLKTCSVKGIICGWDMSLEKQLWNILLSSRWPPDKEPRDCSVKHGVQKTSLFLVESHPSSGSLGCRVRREECQPQCGHQVSPLRVCLLLSMYRGNSQTQTESLL